MTRVHTAHTKKTHTEHSTAPKWFCSFYFSSLSLSIACLLSHNRNWRFFFLSSLLWNPIDKKFVCPIITATIAHPKNYHTKTIGWSKHKIDQNPGEQNDGTLQNLHDLSNGIVCRCRIMVVHFANNVCSSWRIDSRTIFIECMTHKGSTFIVEKFDLLLLCLLLSFISFWFCANRRYKRKVQQNKKIAFCPTKK